MMKTIPTFLSESIVRVREVNSLTQESFGKLFAPPVAQATVDRWEKGEQIPDRKYFPKIASLLNLTLAEFLELIEEQVSDADSLSVLANTQSYIPNQRHLAILNRGTVDWNRWREKNPDIIPSLAGAKLHPTDLSGIDLREADLRKVILTDGNLSHANLRNANLSEAILRDANLNGANLARANLSHADLTGADLRCAVLNGANLQNAVLKFCLVYGISAWDVRLDGAVQENLNICQHNVNTFHVKSLSSAYVEFLAISKEKNHD